MKIGVMLRHLGEPGGIGVYTSNVLRALLSIDHQNEYVLLYDSPQHLGQFADYLNAVERVLPVRNKLWWDQVSVPHFAKREGVDIIFNPKLSIPLLTDRKTVLVMHGAEQFALPWAFKWYDRAYFTLANRLYCRKASAIISMTEIGKTDIAKYMGATPYKIHVVPEAYNEQCHILRADETLDVKERYSLPEKFILFLGGLNPIKNLGNVLRAYHMIHQTIPHKLVVVGFRRWKFAQDLKLVRQLGLEDKVLFAGFVADEEIPVFYNLADAFVFPSLYEGFGIPVLEAMACGCPVIASRTGCSPEVVGDAALLVDPYNAAEIGRAIALVLGNHYVRQELIQKGLQRVKDFSWEKCARETLAVFQLAES